MILAKCVAVFRRGLHAPTMASAIRSAFGDQRELAEGNARLQKSVAVMRDVGRLLPVEIPQVPFDSEIRIVAEQHLARPWRLSSARPNCASAAARTASTWR